MQTPQKPTVLFLEDSADTRELVRFTLEQAGINLISTETVAEAWATALAHDIDLFLLNGMVPHGDSLQLCADLRTIEPRKPIVFYSALAFQTDIEKGMQAGASAYLTKPYAGDLAEELFQYMEREKPAELSETREEPPVLDTVQLLRQCPVNS